MARRDEADLEALPVDTHVDPARRDGADLEALPVDTHVDPARRDRADLEALPVDTDVDRASPQPARPPRRWSRRRWFTGFGATALSIAVVAGPVRVLLDRRAVTRTAAAYAAYRGYEAERLQKTATLQLAAVPDNQAAVDAATAGLDREEAGRLRATASGLTIPIVIDPTNWKMARTLRAALRARAAELDALATWRAAPVASRGSEPPDESAGVTRAVDHAAALLRIQLAATGRRMPSDQPRPLHAADITIHALRGWIDQPTHTVLAASDGFGLIRLNVDTSSVTSTEFVVRSTFQPSGPGSLIGRTGWVAAMVGSRIAAFPDGGAPRLLPIARVDDAFAADRPDAIWVVTGSQLLEVDQHGNQLGPTLTVPPDAVLDPATITGGFVLSRTDAGGLEAWTPANGRRQRITTTGALLLAAHDHVVMWQPGRANADGRAPVHFTDLRTGADTTISSPLDVQMPEDQVATTCAFSPDGRSVACSDLVHGVSGDVYQLGIIDTVARTSTVIPGAQSNGPLDPTPLWTSDSQRVFFVVYAQGSAYLATWARRDSRATELRYHPGSWIGLTIVPSPK